MSGILENDIAKSQRTPVNAPVKARLKWFNIPKGFGFVNPESRRDVDAFLHITTLQEAGVQAVGEGACLVCDIEYGNKGAHVKQVIEVLDVGVLPVGISCDALTTSDDFGRIQKMKGTVKWYKEEEGFGFIIPEDGMKDVFIHKTCLEKHEISGFAAGQKVFMTFRSVPKGREVVSLKIMSNPDEN